MKEIELRLENYLFFPFINGNVKVCGLPLNQNNRLYIQAQPIDGTVIFMEKIDAFQPIPLTEEILLKCGFIIDSINNFEKYPFTIQKSNHYVTDFLFYKNGDSGVVIKYLHQLQNLYFALTGKELEINL